LTAAVAALEQLLRPAEAPAQEARRSDARDRLRALIEAQVAAGQQVDPGAVTLEQLQAENAQLREDLARARMEPPAAAPAPAKPSADNVVALREPTPQQQSDAEWARWYRSGAGGLPSGPPSFPRTRV
jgi:hypothetical protein